MSDKKIVDAIVTRHEPYGFYVDFGADQEGVVVITMISNDKNQSNPPFPPIGSKVKAFLLGYGGPNNQPRLSIRPVDLANSE